MPKGVYERKPKLSAKAFATTNKKLRDVLVWPSSVDEQFAEKLRAFNVNVVPKSDPINPDHYKKYPVECIELTQHMNFCVGNAVKYLYRAGDKDDYVQDLQKAVWYINQEIARVKK